MSFIVRVRVMQGLMGTGFLSLSTALGPVDLTHLNRCRKYGLCYPLFWLYHAGQCRGGDQLAVRGVSFCLCNCDVHTRQTWPFFLLV